jgi:hypothetical protein
MADHVEAESPEAKRFLTALRGVLSVPKAELAKKLSRKRKRNTAKRQSTKTK